MDERVNAVAPRVVRGRWLHLGAIVVFVLLLLSAVLSLYLGAATAQRYVESVESVRSLTIDISDVFIVLDGDPELEIIAKLKSDKSERVRMRQIIYAIAVNGRTLGGNKIILEDIPTDHAQLPLSVALPLKLTRTAQNNIALAEKSGVAEWQVSGKVYLEVAASELWVDLRVSRAVGISRAGE